MYSPDGWLIVSSSKDRTSRIWDLETGACKHILEGHEKSVQDVVFSPQGNQLASASEDSTVRLWSVSTGECQLTLRGHHQGVLRVAYSPKGDVLASGSWDKTVRLWDVASGHCRTVIPNFQDYIGGIAWVSTMNGNYLFAGCKDGSLHKWEFIEEGSQCRLCWSGTNGVLVVTGIRIQDADGLTLLNKKLLKQRGAVGEPVPSMRETGKKVMAMTAVVSKLKQPHPVEMEPESPLILSPTDVPWRRQVDQQATQSGDFQDNVRGQKGDSFLV
jgi:WD40 repeat protein